MNESRNKLADLKLKLTELANTQSGERVALVRTVGKYVLPIIAEIESLELRLQALEQKAPPSIVGE